ncbi:MAG: hypothetical protein IAF38_03485 [Bacteroidia bacterium]|nr:hypothetical protein [Bacteroidia bacterium]
MKKKRMQYFLILVVLAIWGLIGMRFFNFFGGEEEQTSFNEKINDKTVLNMPTIEYAIDGNYPDPFLKGGNFNSNNFSGNYKNSYSSSENSKPKQKKEVVKVEKEKKIEPIDPLASLKLTGIIANRQNGKKSAIVSHDGKEYSINQGETINGIKLSKIFSDSVMITFQKKNKIIRL